MRSQKKCIVCGKQEYVACYCKVHYQSRMAKIRENSEAQGTLKTCSLCAGEGHNKRTCPDRPRRTAGAYPSSAPDPVLVT